MQFQTIIFSLAALATTTMAAPAPAVQTTQTAQGTLAGRWTYHQTTKNCNAANTACAWKFNIDKNDGSAWVPCSFTVTGNPASHANLQPERKCDDSNLALSMEFHDQGDGWWGFALKDFEHRIISFPAFNSGNFHGGNTAEDLTFDANVLNL